MDEVNKEIRVVCAVISDEFGRYLVAKRPSGKVLAGKWEFPGGKVEPGEEPSEALRREIQEEMGADIDVGRALLEVIHHYKSGSICLWPYLARLNTGTLRAIEHEEIRWVSLEEIILLDMADADVPIIHQLLASPSAAT